MEPQLSTSPLPLPLSQQLLVYRLPNMVIALPSRVGSGSSVNLNAIAENVESTPGSGHHFLFAQIGTQHSKLLRHCGEP